MTQWVWLFDVGDLVKTTFDDVMTVVCQPTDGEFPMYQLTPVPGTTINCPLVYYREGELTRFDAKDLPALLAR